MWHNHQEIPIKKFIQFPAKLVCTQLNGAVDKRMMLLLGIEAITKMQNF
jgi:hypothetical protein